MYFFPSPLVSSERSPQGLRRDEVLDVLPHVISIGDDGELFPDGGFASSRVELESHVLGSFREITKDWPTKRLVVYAHGGLVGARSALKDIRPDIEALKRNHCYLMAVVWHSGPIETLINQLKEDWSKFINARNMQDLGAQDMWDSWIEGVVKSTKLQDLWGQMKDNARLGVESINGGARIACQLIAQLVNEDPSLEVHLISHSAGSILQGYLVDYLSGSSQDGKLGIAVDSVSHWAPACTVDFFKERYLPALHDGSIQRYSLITLDDKSEIKDTAFVYRKSLLYLVSRGFEKESTVNEVPIWGMQRFLDNETDLSDLLRQSWRKVPDSIIPRCSKHGSFSEDENVLSDTIKFICKADYTADELDEFVRLAYSCDGISIESLEHDSDRRSSTLGDSGYGASGKPSAVEIMSEARAMGFDVPRAKIGQFILCVLKSLLRKPLPEAIVSCASGVLD